MAELGKVLVLFGIVMVATGLACMLLGRMHLPIGRLPGDFLISWQERHGVFSPGHFDSTERIGLGGALPDSVFSPMREQRDQGAETASGESGVSVRVAAVLQSPA